MIGDMELDDRTRMMNSNGHSLDKFDRKSTVATSDTKQITKRKHNEQEEKN